MKILLAAEESAGLKTLRLLAKSEHTLVALLTKPAEKNGTQLASAARSLNIPVLPAKSLRDPGFADWIATQKIDVLINVHSLYMICKEIINALPMGAYNLHPGLLPDYAGLNAPSWSIYNQETRQSVTLHRINEGIDKGEIISATTFPLSADDTGLTVSLKCVQRGLPLIEQLLEDLHRNASGITGRPQDLSKRVYYRKNQVPWNGKIRWEASSAKIHAFVRACNYSPFESPWGVPKTKYGETEISIFKMETSDEPSHEIPGTIGKHINGKVRVATGDNWILLSRCRVNGEFVNAYTILKPGDRLE